MASPTTPIRLDLKKDEKLEIDWEDGLKSVYGITMLRTMCPCAQCKTVREGEAGAKKSMLRLLPGNWAQKITVKGAELIGNYAIRIDWSDDHGSGIYSFHYLRSLAARG
jgi:DUF971 family protein